MMTAVHRLLALQSHFWSQDPEVPFKGRSKLMTDFESFAVAEGLSSVVYGCCMICLFIELIDCDFDKQSHFSDRPKHFAEPCMDGVACLHEKSVGLN
jgi:hypothetical protein